MLFFCLMLVATAISGLQKNHLIHAFPTSSQIIETMSFSVDVAELTEVLGPFYEYVATEDEEEEEEDKKEDDEDDDEEDLADSGVDLRGGALTRQEEENGKDQGQEEGSSSELRTALGQYDYEDGEIEELEGDGEESDAGAGKSSISACIILNFVVGKCPLCCRVSFVHSVAPPLDISAGCLQEYSCGERRHEEEKEQQHRRATCR